MDLFPSGGAPTLNLRDAKLKDYLKGLILIDGSEQMGNNQSLAIASALVIMPLECLKIHCSPLDLELENESASIRILLACSSVKRLEVQCNNITQYSAVATLLGFSRSTVSA